MLTIDGSFGEGGGQILRSAVALSVVTGTPFRVENIRAKRDKPGLMRQHLTAVQAAATICGAEVEGDAVGSQALTFVPGKTQPGEYEFRIGTAGSTNLVLQTVLLPLLLADQPSLLVIEGGTHNMHAPPFDFLAQAYLPLVNRMGPRVAITLERTGFYPAGGGRILVEIEPAGRLEPIELMERGPLVRRQARAAVARLARHIAERELAVVKRVLQWPERELDIVEITNSAGPGNILTLTLEYANITEVFTGFGELGRSAESVAEGAVRQCRSYLTSTAPVGEYLTDQLMLPLAIAGAGRFVSTGLSLHAETHLELIRKFLDVRIEVARRDDGAAQVQFG